MLWLKIDQDARTSFLVIYIALSDVTTASPYLKERKVKNIVLQKSPLSERFTHHSKHIPTSATKLARGPYEVHHRSDLSRHCWQMFVSGQCSAHRQQPTALHLSLHTAQLQSTTGKTTESQTSQGTVLSWMRSLVLDLFRHPLCYSGTLTITVSSSLAIVLLGL